MVEYIITKLAISQALFVEEFCGILTSELHNLIGQYKQIKMDVTLELNHHNDDVIDITDLDLT